MKSYEQKYKEALERAKGELQTCGSTDCDAVRQIYRFFPELRENEDDMIRKWIIDDIRYNMDNEPLNNSEYKKEAEKAISWLEKQADKKPAKNIVEIWKNMRLEVYQQASGNRHEPNYSDDTTKMFSLNDIDEIIEKISEQKYADGIPTVTNYDKLFQNCNVPKFKVGDWVVSDYNNVTYIESINETTYNLQCKDGNHEKMSIEYIDRYWHLWTIQDAKDGDVVASKHGVPFIYNGNYDSDFLGAYCGITTEGNFRVGTEKCQWSSNKNVHPATKEQCDFLFAKMHEAGFEWDANKKELKKNDTLLDLLHKMPSCITVNGIDYHFVLKKTIAYMAYYEGEGEGSGKVIFWMAGDPIELLTAMLKKLKGEGLLE